MHPLRLLAFLSLCGFALFALGSRIDSYDHIDVEQWRPLVEELFPAEEVDDVLSVMACESHGNPTTRYMEEWGVESVGLMQINEGWLTGWARPEWSILSHNGQPVDLTDPSTNLQAAKFIRHFEDATEQAPWSQWACQPQSQQQPAASARDTGTAHISGSSL